MINLNKGEDFILSMGGGGWYLLLYRSFLFKES